MWWNHSHGPWAMNYVLMHWCTINWLHALWCTTCICSICHYILFIYLSINESLGECKGLFVVIGCRTYQAQTKSCSSWSEMFTVVQDLWFSQIRWCYRNGQVEDYLHVLQTLDSTDSWQPVSRRFHFVFGAQSSCEVMTVCRVEENCLHYWLWHLTSFDYGLVLRTC